MPPSTPSETTTSAAERPDTGAGGDPADQIRLSLTLPGSASLGAFQAGALAALATAINTLRDEGVHVRLDAIGGSSAGSFVALLFTHCLLTGKDTAEVLRAAWVDEVDIELLRSGGSDEPLTGDDLRQRVRSFLDERAEDQPVRSPLEHPVELQVGLTSLLGFTAPVDTAAGTISGLSYADWMAFTLEPGHDLSSLYEPEGSSPVEAVLASASHPVGFSPRMIDRSQDRDGYRARGVTNLPDDGRLWYTDGGLVESDPVGRILEAARRNGRAPAGTRLHLVVDPRSSAPAGGDPWSNGDRQPSWLDGLRRSAAIVPTQALHDDLRRVATANQRLGLLDDFIDTWGLRLAGDADRNRLREDLAAIGGLGDKEPVNVEVISPLLLAGDDVAVNDLLAGDFIATFGGFLDADIRRSDFALGWRCAVRWLPDGLARHQIPDRRIEAVTAALDAAEPDDLDEARMDEAGVGDLRPAARWQLVLLAAQFGRVLMSRALPSPPALPDRLRRLLPGERQR